MTTVSTRDSEVLGCPRRNRWSGQRKLWRILRGNTILAALGTRVTFDTAIGPVDVFIRDTTLLAYRGGKWKSWWIEDLTLLLALCHMSGINVIQAALLQELDSKLTTHYIGAPPHEEAGRLVSAAIERWRSEARIPKNSGRAAVTCPWCPVKAACDAKDLERGETADWPSDYRIGAGSVD